MRRVFKIILAAFIIFIAITASFAAIIFLDLAAYTATSSETLKPNGTPSGTALVVYDPGLSGTAKTVATQIANDLQDQGLTVTLAGIKSIAVANATAYPIIVVGGPVYAGSLTASVRDFLNSLSAQSSSADFELTRLGVFGSGSGASEPEDITQMRQSVAALSGDGELSDALVVKIGQSENLAARTHDFVYSLLG